MEEECDDGRRDSEKKGDGGGGRGEAMGGDGAMREVGARQREMLDLGGGVTLHYLTLSSLYMHYVSGMMLVQRLAWRGENIEMCTELGRLREE